MQIPWILFTFAKTTAKVFLGHGRKKRVVDVESFETSKHEVLNIKYLKALKKEMEQVKKTVWLLKKSQK